MLFKKNTVYLNECKDGKYYGIAINQDNEQVNIILNPKEEKYLNEYDIFYNIYYYDNEINNINKKQIHINEIILNQNIKMQKPIEDILYFKYWYEKTYNEELKDALKFEIEKAKLEYEDYIYNYAPMFIRDKTFDLSQYFKYENNTDRNLKILWISKNEMTANQRNELGDNVEIKHVNKTQNIKQEINEADIIAVSSLTNILEKIFNIVHDKPIITDINDQYGKFKQWKKVKEISIKKEEFKKI